MLEGPCIIYGPCSSCGAPVIVAKTSDGVSKILDPHLRCWALGWSQHNAEPTAFPSKAHAEHRCVT